MSEHAQQDFGRGSAEQTGEVQGIEGSAEEKESTRKWNERQAKQQSLAEK